MSVLAKLATRTEWLITVLADIGFLAASVEGNLSPRNAAIAAAISNGAYAISRGIAKHGTGR